MKRNIYIFRAVLIESFFKKSSFVILSFQTVFSSLLCTEEHLVVQTFPSRCASPPPPSPRVPSLTAQPSTFFAFVQTIQSLYRSVFPPILIPLMGSYSSRLCPSIFDAPAPPMAEPPSPSNPFTARVLSPAAFSFSPTQPAASPLVLSPSAAAVAVAVRVPEEYKVEGACGFEGICGWEGTSSLFLS